MTTKSTSSASGSFAKLMESADSPTPDSTFQPQEAANGVRDDSANGTTKRASVRPVHHAERPNGRTVSPSDRTRETDVRTNDLMEQIPRAPKERKPERYSFQFWDDQIVRLKRLRQIRNLLRDPYERKEITMSDMGRQAIDDYLDKQTKRIKHSERPDA